jgi:tripartite-type tricarboxylate transporter receptor subunit TctC
MMPAVTRTPLFRRAAQFACIAAACAPALAAGQGYPNRPLRFVVPYVPGGVVDFIGRTVGTRLSAQLGQNVVTDNRPGAGGIIGIDLTAKSNPDGYTIVLMDPAVVINPSLQTKVPYDVLDGMTTISVIGSSPLVLAINPQVPAKDVMSLADYARSNPAKVNFASAGVGTTTHMAGEFFKVRIGQNLTHVPYKGAGPAMADLVGGQVQMFFGSITAALPFLKDGRLRGLATTGPKRTSALPELPTMIEAGYPGFEVDLWLAVFGPAKLPKAIVTRLNAETRKALQDGGLREAFARVGVEPRGSGPEEGHAFVRAEFDKWAKVVRDAKLKGTN